MAPGLMEEPLDSFVPTERTRVRRRHERGHYDRETTYAILDAGFICTIGYVIDGQPLVTPTAYWREGDRVYWHGSAASRMLRHEAEGIPVCFTVTHVDGLVVARAAFHTSINYRSVMALGTAEFVGDECHKLAALRNFVERIYPGRWDALRPVTAQEVKATTVLTMRLEEVSAKVRTGQPKDDEEDYALPIWAGVVPLGLVAGPPQADPRNLPGVPIPPEVRRFGLFS
jgi:nitroimidazol reductase NimA-like FMN-containing flavoprotein (pyridoxamine 5'-phosphate oxidase superfamily)